MNCPASPNANDRGIPFTFRVLLSDESRHVEDLNRPTDRKTCICPWITGKGSYRTIPQNAYGKTSLICLTLV